MDTNKTRSDPDIVEMDFPPYVEEQSPFPDVETDFNFEDSKEEIYRRNRIIAAETQLAVLKEENRQKLEKQKQFREMTKTTAAANAANVKNYWDKLVLPVSLITVFAIVLLIVVLSGRLSEPQTNDMSFEESVNSMWFEMESLRFEEKMKVTKAVPETEATQVSIEPPVTETEAVMTEESFAESDNEILKTTAVREPFEAAEGVTVMNTEAMSYKIENPRCYGRADENEYHAIPGSVSVSVDIAVKNLTDYDYAVKMSLFYTEGLDVTELNNPDEEFSGYDESLAEYDDDGKLIWLHFDEKNLCKFTMTLSNFSYFKKRLYIEYGFEDDEDFYQIFCAVREREPSNLAFKYEPDCRYASAFIDIPYESRTVIIEE